MPGTLSDGRLAFWLLGLLLCALPAAGEAYRFGPQDIVAVLQAGAGHSAAAGAPVVQARPAPPIATGKSTPQIVAAPADATGQPFTPERGVVRLAAADLVGRLPAVLGIELGDSRVEATAVFAVKPKGGDVEDSVAFVIERDDGGTYRLAAADQPELAAWLSERSADFMAGQVVLERVDGFDGRAEIVFGADKVVADGAAPVDAFRSGLSDLVGEPLGDVFFEAIDGGSRRLAELRGSVVLVHIWATWCIPCIADMPVLEALEAKHAKRGFRVVNLSDEPVEVISQWLEDNPTPMLHGRRDDFAFLPRAAGVAGRAPRAMVRPIHLLLDRNGIVIEAGTGAAVGSEDSLGSDGANAESAPVGHLARLVEPHLR